MGNSQYCKLCGELIVNSFKKEFCSEECFELYINDLLIDMEEMPYEMNIEV